MDAGSNNDKNYLRNMQVDFIVVGQGISGTFLSYYLAAANQTFVVIDQYDASSASRVAAGIINPVTGRRVAPVWMADSILPEAWKAYHEIGSTLQVTTIRATSVIDFFPSPFMRESFLKRLEENNAYVHPYPEQNQFNSFFNYEFGCGEVRPSYIIYMDQLLPAWRTRLQQSGHLREETFASDQLVITADGVRYGDIIAKKIIFCDGASAAANPYFKNLPFAPNKGEALWLRIPGLSPQHIYKRSLLLVPLATPDLFWLGSAYQWDFPNLEPSKEFYDSSVRQLNDWLKIPFEVIDHRASARPATLERRPFVGLHPHVPQLGILNGMGTKGCSLAPFFAKQLVNHLLHGEPITPEADVKRFTRILSPK